MEFRKCERCGCFYMNESPVCGNCMPREAQDTLKLQDYIKTNGDITTGSIEDLAVSTGIAVKNLNRYLNTPNKL